jgi:hypothetical protein
MTALLTETARGLTTRLDEELRQRKGKRLKRQLLQPRVERPTPWQESSSPPGRGSADAGGEGFEGAGLAGYCQVLLDGIDGESGRV